MPRTSRGPRYRATIFVPMDGDEVDSAGIEGQQPEPQRDRRRWIGAGAAVVVIAIVAIVVASGGGGGGGPLNAIAKAAEVTQREPGGHATIDVTAKSPTTGEGINETGPMIFDDSGRAEGTFVIKGLTNGRELTLTTIADGTKSWTTSSDLDSIPEGKKWVEIDVSSATAQTGAPAASSPKEGLKVLEGVEDAEKIGEEEIEGVPTTHYRGTFPHAKEVFGVKVDVSNPTVDVWIDGQERVRRMQVSLESSVNGVAETAATTEMTIDYVSFGRVPKIEIPPADEVFNGTGAVESNLQKAAEGG